MAQSNYHEQLTGEVIQVGTIVSVDHAARTCTVELGDLVTGELPWFALFAGGVKLWLPPSVGEQGAVLCPEGDLENGVVLPGLYSDANPSPSSSPDIVMLEMPDGAAFTYNHAVHALEAVLPDGGTATLTATTVTINANVQVNGTVTASEDVIGGGKSLKGHTHGGVATGSEQTGAPI